MTCSKDELIKNAAYIGTSGKFIVVADESTGTISKALASTNVENVESYRRLLHGLLFSNPTAFSYISGAILFEEILYQKNAYGRPFVDVLKEGGVLLGIKVDKGTAELPDTNGETTTLGLDGLGQRCQQYYETGARFAKWRAVLKIGPTEPSQVAIDENANGLAFYASTCQQKGLVPIIELHILADGFHVIDKCIEVTKHFLTECYKALTDHSVLLEGTVLKTDWVTSPSKIPFASIQKIAEQTFQVLDAVVPEKISTVVLPFSSKNEVETLKVMKKLRTKMSWKVTGSFRLALKQSTLKTLTENEEIVKDAMAAWTGKEETLKNVLVAWTEKAEIGQNALAAWTENEEVVKEALVTWTEQEEIVNKGLASWNEKEDIVKKALAAWNEKEDIVKKALAAWNGMKDIAKNARTALTTKEKKVKSVQDEFVKRCETNYKAIIGIHKEEDIQLGGGASQGARLEFNPSAVQVTEARQKHKLKRKRL